MNIHELKRSWLAEEAIAHIHGWDFSHINGRYDEERDLPWDYRGVIDKYLCAEHKLLDIDTGGGEFLLSLSHPCENTSATENYPPNVELCRDVLSTKGIDFRPADGKSTLPFEDESFDVVINRHGDYNPSEIYRVLKSGGVFITEQVGAENDRELITSLLPNAKIPFPDQYLSIAEDAFISSGFEIIEAEEAFRLIKFFDVGVLVWFARIIEWEFPGFSVDVCFDKLLKLHKKIEKQGYIEGEIHRFLLVAKK